MLVFGKVWPFTSRSIGLLAQILYILCQLLVCSGKSQLSNDANAHFKNIDIVLAYVISCQDDFMSWCNFNVCSDTRVSSSRSTCWHQFLCSRFTVYQDNTESEMCFTLVQSHSEAQLCLQFRAATMLICIYPLNLRIPCERTLLLWPLLSDFFANS